MASRRLDFGGQYGSHQALGSFGDRASPPDGRCRDPEADGQAEASSLRFVIDASRREVTEVLGTVKHDLTAVKAAVETLTCSDISYSVGTTNRGEARGELSDTFGTEERCLLNSSFWSNWSEDRS